MLVPDTCECRFRLTGSGGFAGKTAYFTLYAKSEFGWSSGQVDVLAAFCDDWATAELPDKLSASWRVEDVSVRDIGSEFGAQTTRTIGVDGTLGGDELPPNVCMVVQFYGNANAPPKQGWVMPPLGDESVVTDGSYTQAFANTVATSFQAFRDDVQAITVPETTQVIVSRSAATEAEKQAIRDARAALREAIAAARRSQGVVNDVDGISARVIVGSQRDRRG